MVKKTLTLSLALVALLCVPLALAASQDTPSAKDDALDDLLKKVEQKEAGAGKPGAETPTPKTEPAPAATEVKRRGDVATKDKDLDSLLEKLGTTEDKPAPEERRGGPGAGPAEPKPSSDMTGKAKKKDDADSLKGRDKDLDEHLEGAAGQRRKKKRQEGDEGGALSQVIKEMREVEERLGKSDTGEATRKKQDEIVKKIETMIEQAKNSQGQSQGKKKSLALGKGKPQPGQQKGDQAGTTGGNAPFTKPQKPSDRRSLAGGKELWGDLPPEVRQDLDNVMKEGFLPSREELIRRYYLSLSKKKAIRGEGSQ